MASPIQRRRVGLLIVVCVEGRLIVISCDPSSESDASASDPDDGFEDGVDDGVEDDVDDGLDDGVDDCDDDGFDRDPERKEILSARTPKTKLKL